MLWVWLKIGLILDSSKPTSIGSWENSADKLRDGAPRDFNSLWDQEDEKEPIQGTKKEQPVR